MKSSIKIPLLIILPVFLLTRFNMKNKEIRGRNEDKWSGTITWTKTSKSKWKEDLPEGIHRWDTYFIFRIEVTFTNNKGTVTRADTTRKWEKDSLLFSKPDNKYLIEEKTTKIVCSGKDDIDLDVEFDEAKKNYWISFYTPDCPEFMSYEKISNIYPREFDSSTNNHQGNQINLPANSTGQPVGNTPNILSGSWEEINAAPNDPGGGSIITRASWNLKKTK